MKTPNSEQGTRTLVLVCNECGEPTILGVPTFNATPVCKCGSRSFTINPTEH